MTTNLTAYEEEVQTAQAILAGIKRPRDLTKLTEAELGAAFLTTHRHNVRLDDFIWREIRALRDPAIKEAKNMRRRLMRQWHATRDHFWECSRELQRRGDAGIAEIEALFAGGDAFVMFHFADLAVERFPDAAEPVFERYLAGITAAERHNFLDRDVEDFLAKIRGYRARRGAGLAPALGEEDAGLAPAMSPAPGTPIDYPESLVRHLAIGLFTGVKTYREAAIDAWRAVAIEQRLDPAEAEKADLAAFDFTIRDHIVYWVRTPFYAKPFAEGDAIFEAATRGLAYLDQDGRPVPAEQLRFALQNAIQVDGYVLQRAAAWTRLR